MSTLSTRPPTTFEVEAWWGPAAVMAVAAVATLTRLAHQPLSWDEAVTLEAARRSPAHLAAMLGHTDAPLGAYYALMYCWVRLLGWVGIQVTAGWLRLPSAMAAIALVGLFVVLVARWFDGRTAVLAGVLLAVHPMLTFYAQDARPYTLVTLGFLASTWALLRAVERPTARRLGVYGVLAIVTLYLQLFAVFAFAAHLAVVGRHAARSRRWFATGAGIGLAVSPLVAVASTQRAEIGWVPKPSPSVVLSVLSHMFGGAVVAPVIGALVVAALAARPRFRGSGWLMWWAFAPAAALVVMDFGMPDLVARYGAVSVPGAVLLAAIGMRRMPLPVRPAVAITLVSAAAITTVLQQSASFKYEDFRAAADQMGDLARPGAAVMFLPASTRAGFEPYRAMERDLLQVRDVADKPGDLPSATSQIAGDDLPAGDLPAQFRSVRMIFVMGDTLAQARTLRDAVDRAEQSVLRGYRAVKTVQYGDISLTELTLGGGQQPRAGAPKSASAPVPANAIAMRQSTRLRLG